MLKKKILAKFSVVILGFWKGNGRKKQGRPVQTITKSKELLRDLRWLCSVKTLWYSVQNKSQKLWRKWKVLRWLIRRKDGGVSNCFRSRLLQFSFYWTSKMTVINLCQFKTSKTTYRKMEAENIRITLIGRKLIDISPINQIAYTFGILPGTIYQKDGFYEDL